MCQSLLIFTDVTFKMAAWQPCWIFQFSDFNFSLTLISSPNFKETYWFQICHFQNGRQAAILDFSVFLLLTLVWLWFECTMQTSVANYLCIWTEAYRFSAMSLPKWPPDDRIRFFSFWTLTSVWLSTPNPNFSSTLAVCMGRWKHNDFEWCSFAIHKLPTVTPPLLGGGILVDHWSTISS